MTSNELRRIFLDYFRTRDHEIVAGSPLVPGNDPTLLFTNSGMVQFKDVFLGAEKRNYSRATTAQPCVRAGGKHNDLDNVGYTARHHTFFEMLGNFSFGDYFKQDAIRYCWELMTEVLGLPPAKLWVTVYKDDEEAERIWFDEIGIDPARFTRCGEKDNFWAMGDTGPCGPCSEVYYDHGPDVPGGPPGSPDEEGDRYVELWNLVFMQFNRDASGAMEPLPRPSVDTGMGLERMAAVLQGVRSNYDTDLFVHLINAAADITKSPDREDKSLRVIADHIRSCAFLINDGVVPANEGRGYVLRRIIRRAIRHGHRLGIAEPFFWRMVGALEAEMGAAYPSLSRRRAHIERTLRSEEEQFSRTLDQGMRILEESIEGLEGNTIPGETVFRLYDTYGFPADLTADIARERSLEIDLEGFEREMEGQRARARAASRFKAREDESLDIATAFCGYERLEDESVVVALLKGGEKTESLEEGDEGMVVLERTPFYAESGGQVGDRGWIAGSPDAGVPNAGSPTSGESGGSGFEFEVVDTCKQGDGAVHVGALRKGRIAIGDPAFAKVDEEARYATARNHSATHLLHAALHLVLGEHVQQKGSLVAPDRLRFDFSHPHPLSKDERHRIETLVSGWILKNSEARTEIMPLDQAKQSGAIALFGEKYDDPVRVLSIGDDSTELCGGTHVRRAGDIGLFKIVSEGGISAGVRRIVALTGEGALAWVQTMSDRLDRIAETIQAAPDAAQERLEALVARNRELERTLSQLQAQAAGTQGDALADKSVDIAGIKVLATRLDDTDIASLRKVVDRLKDRLGAAAVVVATANGDKVSLVAGVTRNCTDRIKAGELANHVASQVGGRGGGRADLAQAGGNDPSRLDEALRSVSEWVQERVE